MRNETVKYKMKSTIMHTGGYAVKVFKLPTGRQGIRTTHSRHVSNKVETSLTKSKA